MNRLILLAFIILVSSCVEKATVRPQYHTSTNAKPYPQRIISLDFCADQYVLKLAERSQILAVSPDAEKSFSYMRHAAAGVPKVTAKIEDVVLLKPDLVVLSYGGGLGAEAFFDWAGIPVLKIGWTTALDGEGADAIPAQIIRVAKGLGQAEAGIKLARVYRQKLKEVADKTPSTADKQALYLTPAGVTTGEGTLMHQMIVAAGLVNFDTRKGWHPTPLERLAYEAPDIVVQGFADMFERNTYAWSVSRHPLVRNLGASAQTIPLDGAWTACGGWFIANALESLLEAHPP